MLAGAVLAALPAAAAEFTIASIKALIAEETILIGDSDFGPLATKIAAAKPDAIWLGSNAAQAANLVIQLKQAGVSPNVALFGTAGLGVDYLKIGGKAVENTYFSIDFNDQSTVPMNVRSAAIS